jgi:hypothetical protein
MTQTSNQARSARLLLLVVTIVGAVAGLLLVALVDAKVGVIVLLATGIVSSLWTSVYEPGARRGSLLGSAMLALAIVLIAQLSSLG